MTRTAWIAVFFVTLAGTATAEEPAPATSTAALVLPEVEVTATRRAGPAFASPRASSAIGAREIEDRQARTAPEALRETPGVMVQQTAYGQGSPFVRGLTGNQVLILVDGVRLNNSTFRFGANQYLSTVDPFTIARIEVVRGPSSVLYGSDALGGVVHVLTKEPAGVGGEPGAGGEATLRYGSAAGEKTGRVSVQGSAGAVGALAGGTYSDFDDLRGGRRTGVQPSTAYRSEAADLKVVAAAGPHEVTLAHQYARQHDVPRSDRLNLALPGRAPANLELRFEPQRRHLTYLAYALGEPAPPLAAVRANVSFHRQDEGRWEITTARPTVERRDYDRVETWGGALELESAEFARQVLTAGGEVYRDRVSSARREWSLVTGASSALRPRFADGGRYATLAGFVQDEVRIVPERLALVLGGRYTHVEVDGAFADPRTGPVDLDRKLDALTGSAHVRAAPLETLAIVGGVAQGFRAPNFDDLSVFGQVGQGFEVPNPRADPERSTGYEVGLKLRAPGDDPLVTGAVFGHWTEYRDLLQRAPGTLDGLPFVDENGNGVQDPAEQFVVQRRNIGRARIFGIEAEARLRLPERVALGSERWQVFGHFFWTYGMNLEDDEPVRGIPPAQGLAGVRAEWDAGRFFIEGVGTFAREQDRLAAADRSDPRFPPGGTAGYETYALRAGARVPLREGGPEMELRLAIENILDRDYRVHGSGVNGAGTNVVLTAGLSF